MKDVKNGSEFCGTFVTVVDMDRTVQLSSCGAWLVGPVILLCGCLLALPVYLRTRLLSLKSVISQMVSSSSSQLYPTVLHCTVRGSVLYDSVLVCNVNILLSVKSVISQMVRSSSKQLCYPPVLYSIVHY
jgi:hypothetical protein